MSKSRPRTAQQVFDTVARHLFQQGERSMAHRGCAYRGENGRKCPAGALMPDPAYDPGMETHSVYEIVRDYPAERLPRCFHRHTDLIAELQVLHDDERSWTSQVKLRKLLKCLAEQYNLRVALLDTLRFPKKSRDDAKLKEIREQ